MAALASADLLRLATAGSVDDGKSTLIGRLLFDSKPVLDDQLEHVEEASRRRSGDGQVDLSLLTDGLRAEREQGITIDVAYRYFATTKRTFIIADTPGHVQYTRNMVTGASTADLAVILVDARKGVLEQSKRHAFISSLLGIPHLVVAVNKMDLVDYDEEVFDTIVREFSDFARGLGGVREIAYFPISAKLGDNVVDRVGEHAVVRRPAAARAPRDGARSPTTATSTRCASPCSGSSATTSTDYRGYAGQVAGGVLRPGDEVLVLPSGLTTRIAQDRHVRRAARRGRRRHERDAPARGRARRLARRHHLPRRQRAAARPASSRRPSAGWPTRRCAPARATRSSTRRTARGRSSTRSSTTSTSTR